MVRLKTWYWRGSTVGSNLYAGIFWSSFLEEGKDLLEKGVAPEFHFSPEELDSIKISDLERVSSLLSERSFTPTIHAPYIDFYLSVRDPMFVDAVKRRIVSFRSVIEGLFPSFVVVHGGYDPFRFDGNEDAWFHPFSKMLEFLLSVWDVPVLIENTFEWHPSSLLRAKKEFGDAIGFCFDVAHAFLYGRVPPGYWLDTLGDGIKEVHLSDNGGVLDDHLPLGMGRIDKGLLKHIFSLGENVLFTIEVFRKDLFWKGVESLLSFRGGSCPPPS